MPVKKVGVEKKSVVKKTSLNLSIPVFSLEGKETGTVDLPKEVFGAPVNKKLLAQAVRVYMTNQKNFTGSTKTRGEVNATTAKWFRQKGTGRARHGAQSAPIFVGGGIAFGPKFRNVRLDLPKKMKKAALVSALSDKMVDQKIVGVTGLEDALGKTKQMAQLMNQISLVRNQSKKNKTNGVSILLVTADKNDNALNGIRNLPKVHILPANELNAYEVIKHRILVIEKNAVNFWSPK